MKPHSLIDPCIVVSNEAATLVAQTQGGFTIWRIVIPILLLICLAGLGFCMWITGMLMFTFALDGANSQNLPGWLEPFMLIVWPIVIGIAVVVTPTCVAFGANWWQALMAFLVSTICCVIFLFVGVIALMSSL